MVINITAHKLKEAKYYLSLSRPKHWLKNIFIFVPITFALALTEWDELLATTVVFAAFCLISSAIYVINDIADVEKDRKHPTKCMRPIASGKITIGKAIVFALFLLGAGFALIVTEQNYLALLFAAIYFFLNIAYSFSLKHYAVIDCFCIAAGFVLRVFAGGTTYGGGISDWLFLTVVVMSLFMAFGKRRGEMLKTDSASTRKVLKNYNELFLSGMVFSFAALSIVFYSLWAMERGLNMIYTVPLVAFIMCKYLLLILDADSHGDPTTVIFKSKTLLFACAVYGITTICLLYWGVVV